MLVAAHLLRLTCALKPTILHVVTRRTTISQAERDAYEAYLDAPLILGGERAQLVLNSSLLSASLMAAYEELEAYFSARLARAMPSPAEEAPLIAQMRAAIQLALPHDDATLARVAACVGLGPRTLQRRLLERGLKFGQLLEQTRRALATSYLRDPERTLLEITYLLGYSEQAAFTRAFKRWYHTTPAIWRALDADLSPGR